MAEPKRLSRFAIFFLSISPLCLIWASFWGPETQIPLTIVGFLSYGVGLYFQQRFSHKNELAQLKLKALASKNELITQSSHNFVVDMIVELRRPLHGILGTKALFENNDTLTDEQKSLSDVIDFCGTHMLDKLERIQFYSEIESGQMRKKHNVIHLHTLLRNSIEKTRAHAGDKKISFECNVESTVPKTLQFNSYGITVLLDEILRNSAHYTSHGKISIDCKLDPGDSDQLIISVHDTGPGLSSKQIQQNFGKNRSLKDPIPWHERGAGLGFSIIKSTVRSMGGQIHVESERRQGASFHLSLPIRKIESLSHDIEDRGYELFSAPETSGEAPSNSSILIVDDENFARTIMHGMLTKHGFHCDIAKNGVEALEMCRKTKYQLIFMDIQMPVMDGWNATEAIRREAGEDSQPYIVALTSHTRASDKEQCEAAGMSGFISKPIKKSAMLEVLNQVGITPHTEIHLDDPVLDPEVDQTADIILLDDYRAKKHGSGVMQARTYLINFDNLYNHYSEDMERCREILARTTTAISPLVRKLNKSVMEKNYKEMSFVAHQIKGEFAYIMCESGVALADSIEKCYEPNKKEIDVEPLVDELNRSYRRLKDEVHQLLEAEQLVS